MKHSNSSIISAHPRFKVGMPSAFNYEAEMFDDNCVTRRVKDVSDVSWVAKPQPRMFKDKMVDPLYRKLFVNSIVEIKSVTIHSNGDGDLKKCEIYGKITLRDKVGKGDTTFDIFARSKDDPECIDDGCTLSLSSPSFGSNGGVNAVVPSSDWVGMDVSLFDKAQNDMVIAKGVFTLSKKLYEQKFEGECGFARVSYASYLYAVVANVDVFVRSKHPEFHGVFGTVTARNIDTLDGKDDLNTTLLFTKSPDQSVNATSVVFNQFAESIAAIPVLSSLQIEIDLCDYDSKLPIGKHVVDFNPEDGTTLEKDIDEHNHLIRVRVRWVEKKQAPKHYYKHYYDRRVTPLVEIFSVSVCSQMPSDGKKREVYGHIRVVDNTGVDTFDLFQRGRDEPECIDLDGTLLLSSPSLDSNGNACAVLPLNSMRMSVRLLDKAHNDLPIAVGEFPLNKSPIGCKEKQICKKVLGTIGFAEVHYAILPYAVVATVDVLYFTRDDEFHIQTRNNFWPFDSDYKDGYEREMSDDDDNTKYDELKFGSNVIDIFGTVTARNDLVFHGSSSRKDYFNSSVLFRKSCEQSVKVRSGEFIQLSRSVVAVSAYSTLRIKVDLSDANTQLPICKSTLEFSPRDCGACKEDIVGDSRRIRVRVKWGEGYDQLDRVKWGEGYDQLDLQTIPEAKPDSFMMPAKTYCHPLVEVFSVVVSGFDHEPLSIYGTVNVVSAISCIFFRDADRPLSVASDTHLQLDCHRTFTILDEFCMSLNIKDVNKSTISKGQISWQGRFGEHTHWLNRRVCSIVRGERGFAAVHYSIIGDALSAQMSVQLCGNAPLNKVSGKISAYYDTRDYQSIYDKGCYSSVLFQKDAKEGLIVGMDVVKLPLLKSVISFPKNSSLIFDVDLMVSRVNMEGDLLPPKALKGKIKLNAADLVKKGENSSEIEGECGIYVVVSCLEGVFY